MMVIIPGYCSHTTHQSGASQKRPQQETDRFVDFAVDHRRSTQRAAAQSDGSHLAIGQQQLAVEAFTIGTHIRVHLAVF
ncbi:hypothetical protein [Pseudomonas nitroreducens]|uniref:hypothetical protein n=1 Tax=Pseudomonas nitroreducens TaxID=46680 RepID=UPI002D801A68|nr:hypothetical protein [Pseudomonas nitroreducens]